MTNSTPPNLASIAPFITISPDSYESYLPTAFDSELTLLQKVNKLIQTLNAMGLSFNDVVDQWNTAMTWVTGDGLTTDVDAKLDGWKADGTLDTIINQDIFNSLNDELTTVSNNPVQAGLAPFNLVSDGTDKSAVLQQILNYLRDNPRKTVVLPTGNYICNQPLTLYAGSGTLDLNGSMIDFTGLTSGYALSIIPSSDDTYNVSLPALIKGRLFKTKNASQTTDGVFIGRPSNVSTGNTQDITLNFVRIDGFRDNIVLANQTWCNAFSNCFIGGFWRSALNVQTLTNAGENIVFDHCIFANGDGYPILHTTGTVELTFKNCSFDYNKGVLSANNAGYRAIMRFIACHFEDDGSTTEFNVNTGSESYYVILKECDWYFTNIQPTNLGVFTSSGSSTRLMVKDCVFPINTTTQDRSLAELFNLGDSIRKTFEGNTIESSLNNYFQVMSRSLNRYPDFSSANLTSGFFSFNGGGPLVTDSSKPTGAPSTLTYKITGYSDFWAHVPYHEGREVRVTGWINRTSTAYGVQARYFNVDGVQLSLDTISAPGTLSAWVKFGQKLLPPKGTHYIRLALTSSTATGTDTCYVNDWNVSQI